jgi:hypothetical protein
MLVKVEIHTRQGTILSLPLDDVSGGYAVEEVGGLDPVKATLVSSSFANADGQQYHSSRRESRNLKLKLGLEADFVNNTVSELRQRLYSYLMPKTRVMLRFFMSSGLSVDIYGRVEEFTTPHFTEEPAVDISLMCFDPDFIDPVPVQLNGTTTSLTNELLVDYEGTVETGLELVMSVNRILNEFTVYHRHPDGVTTVLDFAAPLVAGDTLRISSVPGAKGAWLTRTGSQSSLLYGVSPQSNWFELENGENHFRVYATGAAIPYTISYFTRYGGL